MGARVSPSKTEAEAVADLQASFDALGKMPYTRVDAMLQAEAKATAEAERLACSVLGY